MSLHKATLISFDSEEYTATVSLAGSYKSYLEDLTVARNLTVTEMVAGRGVSIVFFDEHNPAEAVIIAVHD